MNTRALPSAPLCHSYKHRISAVALGLLALVTFPALSIAAPRETGSITRVVDGDTIVVQLASGRKEHVRLIGVDTPESKPNKRAALQAKRSGRDESAILELGKKAWHNTEVLAPVGTNVELELDVQPRDKYKRLLAYVYLPDGRMLNEEILRSGYGNLLTIPPDVRYTERFRSAYEESREGKRGLWSEPLGW